MSQQRIVERKTYPLPRGGSTNSERTFKREWRKMKEAFVTVFGEQAFLIGHGPGALIGHHQNYTSFDLPQWALDALLDHVESLDDC